MLETHILSLSCGLLVIFAALNPSVPSLLLVHIVAGRFVAKQAETVAASLQVVAVFVWTAFREDAMAAKDQKSSEEKKKD